MLVQMKGIVTRQRGKVLYTFPSQLPHSVGGAGTAVPYSVRNAIIPRHTVLRHDHSTAQAALGYKQDQ